MDSNMALELTAHGDESRHRSSRSNEVDKVKTNSTNSFTPDHNVSRRTTSVTSSQDEEFPRDKCMKSGVSRSKKFKYDNSKDVNKQNGDDEDESALSCYFNDLPDELINNIFSYLDLGERIRVERVCKRWQHVNTNETWVNMHVLNLRDKFTGINEKDLTDDILISILKRCGRTLREIIFNSKFYNLSRSYAIHIAKYCPNLESADLSKTSLEVTAIKSIVDMCNGMGEEGLWWLLKTGKKIKYLDLSHNYFSGECFHLVNDSLETLILHKCIGVTSTSFFHLRNSRIKHLNVNKCPLITPEILLTVVTSLSSTLTELHCRGYFVGENGELVKIVEQCHNLQHLDLAKNHNVDHQLVFYIFQKCKQLRYLDISGTRLVDSKPLCQLPHLKTVILNCMVSITSDFLITLSLAAKLEHVELRGNNSIDDVGCIALIQNCPDLKLLDVSSCRKVTDLIVNEACVLERSNNTKLEIIAGGSNITNFIDSGVVHVSETNLCPFEDRNIIDLDYLCNYFVPNGDYDDDCRFSDEGNDDDYDDGGVYDDYNVIDDLDVYGVLD